MEGLSEEILVHIFTYLDLPSLIRLEQANKYLSILSRDSYIWEQQARNLNLHLVIPPNREFRQLVLSNMRARCRLATGEIFVRPLLEFDSGRKGVSETLISRGTHSHYADLDGQGRISLWNAISGECMARWTVPDSVINYTLFDLDGTLACVCVNEDRSLMVWDCSTEPVTQLQVEEGLLNSHDGALIRLRSVRFVMNENHYQIGVVAETGGSALAHFVLWKEDQIVLTRSAGESVNYIAHAQNRLLRAGWGLGGVERRDYTDNQALAPITPQANNLTIYPLGVRCFNTDEAAYISVAMLPNGHIAIYNFDQPDDPVGSIVASATEPASFAMDHCFQELEGHRYALVMWQGRGQTSHFCVYDDPLDEESSQDPLIKVPLHGQTAKGYLFEHLGKRYLALITHQQANLSWYNLDTGEKFGEFSASDVPIDESLGMVEDLACVKEQGRPNLLVFCSKGVVTLAFEDSVDHPGQHIVRRPSEPVEATKPQGGRNLLFIASLASTAALLALARYLQQRYHIFVR